MLLLVREESLSSSEEQFLLSPLEILGSERKDEKSALKIHKLLPTQGEGEERHTFSAAILFLLSASRSAFVLLVSLSLIFSPNPRLSCFSAASALAV